MNTITIGGRTIRLADENTFISCMEETIEPELAALRTEKEVDLSGGITLHTERYIVPGAKQAVIILHGFTESAEKLREVVWYFVQAGMSVFSYDQQGHGRSTRWVEDESITHVEHFQDYVNDLEEFILREVRPVMKDAPLCLYAHSMGGAVGAHFLLRHPETIARAVLTSPMIAPSSGAYPMWLGRAMARFFCLIGKGRERAFIAGPFDPKKETFEKTGFATSPERFGYYQLKRITHRYLQNCGPSYRWVAEAIDQRKGLFRANEAAAVKTKVMLCQAGLDTVVLLPYQDRFIAQIPGGVLKRYDAAKHEIFLSADDVMHPYMRDVVSFLMGEE